MVFSFLEGLLLRDLILTFYANTLVSGTKIANMEKDSVLILMAQNIKEITNTINLMDMDSFNGLLIPKGLYMYMRDIGK